MNYNRDPQAFVHSVEMGVFAFQVMLARARSLRKELEPFGRRCTAEGVNIEHRDADIEKRGPRRRRGSKICGMEKATEESNRGSKGGRKSPTGAGNGSHRKC